MIAASLLATLSVVAGAAEPAVWYPVWGASPSSPLTSTLAFNQSVRTVIQPQQSGERFRIVLSNEEGQRPITLVEVYLGIQSSGATLVAGSNQPVRFAQNSRVVIPVGGVITSDPIDLPVEAGQKLAISFHVQGTLQGASQHGIARENAYLSNAGNQAAAESGANYLTSPLLTLSSWPLIRRLDVERPAASATRVIVAAGDSLTDGFQSFLGSPVIENKTNLGRDERYPDFLRQRLRDAGADHKVLNAGISSNQLLTNDPLGIGGKSLLSRLSRDVLSVPGVTDVILLIGMNDLGLQQNRTANQVIAGLQQAIATLKGQGVRVVVGTLMPGRGSFLGLQHGTAKTEARRQQINQWIRGTLLHDGIVDFDACLRDPSAPAYLNPAFDSGDRLHPNAAGYQQMAACVDLELLGISADMAPAPPPPSAAAPNRLKLLGLLGR